MTAVVVDSNDGGSNTSYGNDQPTEKTSDLNGLGAVAPAICTNRQKHPC